MSQHFHAVVWIDHHEARVFHFSADDVERAVVHPGRPTRHIHHKANSVGSGHTAEDQEFFRAVVDAISTAGAVLIGGPANAKQEFYKHIQRHAPQLLPRIAAVETLDHPSDGELLAHARQFFRAADRMAPQRT
ncbi:MAG: translational machinery protein [Steroidobacterales bacterium]